MILSELNTLLDGIQVPVETGYFEATKPAPDQYVVISPIYSDFELYADNIPHMDTHEVRLTLYSKTNYIALARKIARGLIRSGFTVVDRSYLGYDREFGYHQYTIDVQKTYPFDLEGK